MIVLRTADFRAVSWKNGGGITREIHREPPEPAPFDWRLSLATISAPGPFSSFAGYDRTLLLVSGAGVELTFRKREPVKLAAPGQMVCFDGSWETTCALLDGPSTDLNLIVSRARTEASSQSIEVSTLQPIETAGWTQILVSCVSGAIELTNTAGRVARLGPVDVAISPASDGPLACRATDSNAAKVFIARLRAR